MLTADQQAIRRNAIGSSEIAKVCGRDFYNDGPHAVWKVKRGLESERGRTIDTLLGDVFEEHVVPLLYQADGNGSTLARDPVPTRVHPEHPWMAASVDWLRETDLIPVECKWIASPYRAHYFEAAVGLRNKCQMCGRGASMHWGREPDAIPDDVRMQCAWQMAVLGAPWMHVARLWIASFSRDFSIYTIKRNMALETKLIARGKAFWFDHIVTGTPPPPDGTDANEAADKLLFPKVLSGMEEAPSAANEWAEQWFRADEMIEEGTRLRIEATARLRRLIGSSEGIQTDAWKATNKARADGARVFRLTRKKAHGKR